MVLQVNKPKTSKSKHLSSHNQARRKRRTLSRKKVYMTNYSMARYFITLLTIFKFILKERRNST